MEKKTSDGKVVPDRCWYYLLDFNDRDNWETLYDMFNKTFKELNHDEFWKLFKVATEKETTTNGEYFNLKDKQIKGQI